MPAVAGTRRAPGLSAAICSSVNAPSLAPKSTVWARKRLTPSPLPTSRYSMETSGFWLAYSPIHFLYSGAGKVAPAPSSFTFVLEVVCAAPWLRAVSKGRDATTAVHHQVVMVSLIVLGGCYASGLLDGSGQKKGCCVVGAGPERAQDLRTS